MTMEPRIPDSYHPILRLLGQMLQESPDATRKELRRRVMNVMGLPLDWSDPFWDEPETSYLHASRTRRLLFNDRFNLAMHKLRNEEQG